MTGKVIAAPCIHWNGTSKGDLLDTLADAFRAIGEAVDKLAKCCPHARDYYVIDSDAYNRAANDHRARLRKLREVREELQALAEAIHDGKTQVEIPD